MDIGKHWRTIIESVQDGVLIVDANGNFVAANHTAQLMTGYSEEELLGRSCRILNCTGCRILGEGPGKQWCGLFIRGLIREKRCLISHRNNRSVQVLKSATVLFDDDVLNDNQFLEVTNPRAKEIIETRVKGVEGDKRFVYYLLAATGICVVPLTGFCCERKGFRVTMLETDDEKREWTWNAIAQSIRQYLESA